MALGAILSGATRILGPALVGLSKVKTAFDKIPRKAKIAGGLGAGAGLLWLLRNTQEETEPTATPTTPTQKHPETQKKQPKQQKPVTKQPDKRQESESLSPVEALTGLAQYSVLLGREYDIVKQHYLQNLSQYQEQLDKLIPAITVLTMKTPLSALTNEDLPEKVRNMFQYSSFASAVESVPKLISGYYIAKANGINTEPLTETDLLTIAENPAFVQNVNENFIQAISTIAEHIKLQMNTHLHLLGKLKDEYAFKLNTLKATAGLMKNIADIILKQKDLEIKEYKAKTDAYYKARKTAIEEEKLKLKRQQKTDIPSIEVKE